MPTSSVYPDVDIPDVDIWGFLFEGEHRIPYPEDKVIYIDPYTSRSYTFKQVKDTAIDFGKGLKAVWDFQKNDVVCLYTPNCIDTPAIIWGTQWAGGIISPANPGYSPEELAFQLKDSGASVIITQMPMLEHARKAAKIAGVSEDRIAVIGDQKDPQARVKHFTSIRNISGATRYRRVKKKSTDLAFLVYSSGTTGLPKGVMLSHRNIVANSLQGATLEGNLAWNNGPNGEGDKILGFLPFFHIYGLTCLIHHAIYRGIQLYVMPKFDLPDFCRFIQEFKITFVYAVPPVILLLAKHEIVSKYDLSSLRMLNSGAAPLTKDIILAIHERLGVRVKQGYGLSETSPTTHLQAWEAWNNPWGSVGKLLPNLSAKYVGEDEKEVEAGQVGELWMKGPNIFMGYLNNEKGTRDCLTEDGWFRTGDVGYQDKDGNFFITDRVKELIKYKGFQVPPAELEGYLAGHAKIDDVAVLGIYSEEQATELPRAYIVLKKGVSADKSTADEISNWLAGKVASHKKLRGGIRFTDEIPKSVSGKILRRVLKEQAKTEDGAPKAKL
ncbi:putative phenylacetyl-CoA ligase [Pseudovirgaria hyperparasitica]|uniref:Putative phenylacetyl-CoA ligase n=1 Tax=Pseudovirgaria hyperparasitica TaxID=470096 RepID=A0A6A6W2U6_9PEZI|nr:putative phenylacetyl-CoA ligase [Pseudovirgaria hyperparasitica]KAF2757258.1 putative phenylacetyl-CoA ligase [Pseudovirgaria hyperparasitica]